MFMNFWLKLLFGCGVLYLGGFLFAYFYAERIMLPGSPPSYDHVEGSFFLKSPAGPIQVCYWDREKDAKTDFLPSEDYHLFSEYTLIYNPGNTQDLGQIEPYARQFCAYGFDVIGYEYPGNGYTPGVGTERKVYEAAESVYHYLTDVLGKDPAKILLYGFSLGGGPAVHLATKYSVAGLILECTFASAYRVKTHWKLLPIDAFDNLAKIQDTHCPLLVIHSLEDKKVDPIHSQWLVERVPACHKFWVAGAHHTNAGHVDPVGYDQSLKVFMNEVLSRN